MSNRILERALEDEGVVSELLQALDSVQRAKVLRNYSKVLRLVSFEKITKYVNQNLGAIVERDNIPWAYFPTVLKADQSIDDFQKVLSAHVPTLDVVLKKDVATINSLFTGAFSEKPEEWLLANYEEEGFNHVTLGTLEYFQKSLVIIVTDYLERDTRRDCSLHRRNVSTKVTLLKDFLHISKRQVLDYELLELEENVVEWVARTAKGQELVAMIIHNQAIQKAFEQHEGISVTTTNYVVPEANYWTWDFGVSKPERKASLNAKDARIAKSLFEQDKHRIKVSPWVEVE